MMLCLDVGNSNICGGVFKDEKLQLRFRYKTDISYTSDQLGVFLKNVLRENNIESKSIHQIAICSVVPAIDYSLRSACKKYFAIDPFVLQAGTKTGIKIKANNPQDKTVYKTVFVFTDNKEFLGATFLPGLRTTMRSLGSSAAKLFSVEILHPERVVGRSTIESIQAGVYYGHIGAIKEIVYQITQEAFSEQSPVVIATGGFCYLFEDKTIFNHIEPDLVLQGIRSALIMNLN